MENIDESIDDPVEHDTPLKKKRVVSERQLENLKQARELARKALAVKRKETTEFKMKEKQLKLLTKLEKARTTERQLVDLREKCLEPVATIPQVVPMKVEPLSVPSVEPVKVEPVKVESPVILKKKKKTKPRIVWVSDSDSSEEEIVYKKKKTKPPVVPPAPVEPVKPDQEAVKHMYNEKMAKIRREYVMSQMFPC